MSVETVACRVGEACAHRGTPTVCSWCGRLTDHYYPHPETVRSSLGCCTECYRELEEERVTGLAMMT